MNQNFLDLVKGRSNPDGLEILKAAHVSGRTKFTEDAKQAVLTVMTMLDEGKSLEEASKVVLNEAKPQVNTAIAKSESGELVGDPVFDEVKGEIADIAQEVGRQAAWDAVDDVATAGNQAKEEVTSGLPLLTRSNVFEGAVQAMKDPNWQAEVAARMKSGKK